MSDTPTEAPVINLFTRAKFEVPPAADAAEQVEKKIDTNALTVATNINRMIESGDCKGYFGITFTELGEPMFSFVTPEGEGLVSGVVRLLGAIALVKDRLIAMTYPDDSEDEEVIYE